MSISHSMRTKSEQIVRKIQQVGQRLRRVACGITRCVRAVLIRVRGGFTGARLPAEAEPFASLATVRVNAGEAACGLLDGKPSEFDRKGVQVSAPDDLRRGVFFQNLTAERSISLLSAGLLRNPVATSHLRRASRALV